MSRLAPPRPSTHDPATRFSAVAERGEIAGDRSGAASALMVFSGTWRVSPSTGRWKSRSEVHPAHVFVAIPAGDPLRRGLVDPLQVLSREGDLDRGHVLFQVLAALGAGD